MCGIAGMIGPDVLDSNRIEAALSCMRQRGPDASGSWSGRVGEVAVTLLHTRLAIIDLDSRADQPFETNGCVVTFNGEIYNYIELKRDLEARGHAFSSNSDTEVLLRSYLEWGEGCLDRLDGMWAFAIVDQRAGKVLLSRDRFGEKPLYWWRNDGALYFASEVKALCAMAGASPRVNADQVRRYLVNGYKSLFKKNETYFLGIRQLPAATLAWLRGADDLQPKAYWKLEADPVRMSMEDAVEGTRERLVTAVESRMRADTPVAFCLSGGVDSASLTTLAAKQLKRPISAFSILDGDERYDERKNMEATVRDIGCDWHPIETSTAGFLDRLEAICSYHDAPVATISYYVHDFLSEAISKAGFKVAISGTAADEIFTGYYDHYGFWLAEMSEQDNFDTLLEDWRRTYGRHVRNPVLQNPLTFRDRPSERGHVYLNRELFNGWMIEPTTEAFSEASYGSDMLRCRMMNELFHESVPVILQEDDANSMRWSVENRAPFLARDLVEFAYSIPVEHLIHDGYPKWVLRSAVPELNDTVRSDDQKRGFNASIDSLLDRKNSEVRERLLEPGPIFEIVRRDAIEDLLDADLTDNSFSKFAFSFVAARLFLDSDVARGGLLREAA